MRLRRDRGTNETEGTSLSSRAGSAGRSTVKVALLTALAAVLLPPTAASADECANAELRKGASAHLADCRAYEQVSPVDKNGGDIAAGFFVGRARTVAVDGEAAIFSARTEFAGAQSGWSTSDTEYLARRTEDGWETVPQFPRVEPASLGGSTVLSTPDLGHSLLRSGGIVESSPVDPFAEDVNLYIRDSRLGLVSPLMGISVMVISDPTANVFVFPAVTRDLGHVVFTSSVALTGSGEPSSSSIFKVYERVGGVLRLVSVAPDGTPVQSDTKTGGATSSFSSAFSIAGAVSDDGRHVFYRVDGADIFRRSDGSTTVLASPSQRTAPDPGGARAKQFHFATPDGNRVFFTSPEMLTDDANTGAAVPHPGNDLYRYDLAVDELVDISATAGGNGAEVLGVMGFADHGERVYYIARGEVVPGDGPGGDPDPTPGEPNLYLWEDDGTADGATRFIATLSAADSPSWLWLDGRWTARTTPDGGQVAFESGASISGHNGGGTRQVYRYDAEANGGDGDLVCVSCTSAGSSVGPAAVTTHAEQLAVQPWELPRWLSDDGRRVFFNSPNALVPGDTNGEIDAYMWEDGVVSLLSTGKSDVASRFYNAGADGRDAFIVTAEALVPQDKDDLVDLYDARVGGGFPPPAPDPDCDGELCQGSSPEPPPAGDAGSAAFRGRGDVASARRLGLAVRRPAAAQLRRLARGRRIGLRVAVGRAGVVRATVRARIGARRRVVAVGLGRAREPGRVVVRLRLTRQARRALRREGSLRLTLHVRSPGAGARTLTLRLRSTR